MIYKRTTGVNFGITSVYLLKDYLTEMGLSIENDTIRDPFFTANILMAGQTTWILIVFSFSLRSMPSFLTELIGNKSLLS